MKGPRTSRRRIGEAKVRFPSNNVKKAVVFEDGDGHFIFRRTLANVYLEVPVRPVDPPEDYPTRRSGGLIEWEVAR